MIEFPQRNPHFVSAIRDGIDIGYLQETKNPARPGETMWSGIVDSRVIKADTLCQAKQRVHDVIDDHAAIDITPAGMAAINQHGPMQRAKLRAALEHGRPGSIQVSTRYQLASSLIEQNRYEEAAEVMSALVPVLEEMLRRLKFAGIQRPVVAEQAAE